MPPGGNPPATTVINPPGPRPTTSVESARPIPPRHAGTAKILWATPPIDSEKLRQAIDRATGYLVKHCRPNGKFEYVVHPDPSVNLAPSYNILRHAGAIFSLGMAHKRSASGDVRETMLRATEFLQKHALAEVSGTPDMAAIWSKPTLNHGEHGNEAKLGGTALGILALRATAAATTTTPPSEQLRRLGNFLLYMQNEDGSFRSIHVDDPAEKREFQSLYYPGQAALALAELYQLDQDTKWLEAGLRGIAFLEHSQRSRHQPRPDHWMLLAAARLLQVYDECPTPAISRSAMFRHVTRTCNKMIQDQQPYLHDTKIAGCFVDDGRTTPSAIRLEGLLAALSIMGDDHQALKQEMQEAIIHGIRFLLRCQVLEGPYAGGIPCASEFIASGDPTRDEEAKRHVAEIRIDYVQHALSAMIQYETWVAGQSIKAP